MSMDILGWFWAALATIAGYYTGAWIAAGFSVHGRAAFAIELSLSVAFLVACAAVSASPEKSGER